MSDQEQATRERAINLLARREHSRQELIRKLQAKGLPVETIEPVVDALTAEGLQSDERFTESFIHTRMVRGYGPVRIRQELKERGVADELVNIRFEATEVDWREVAAQVREKKFGAGLPDDYRERARQSRFLHYRGFSGELISSLFKPDE